jgi:hypothetical protein
MPAEHDVLRASYGQKAHRALAGKTGFSRAIPPTAFQQPARRGHIAAMMFSSRSWITAR